MIEQPRTPRTRLWVALCVAALALAVLVTSFFRARSSPNQVITIGAVLPLTGQVAQYGQYMKQGLELGLADAEKRGVITPGQVRLVIEDGGGEPARSLSAFQKLLSADKPSAVVGALSGVILPIKPLANKNHVVLLNGSSISTDIEDADDFSFSVIPDAGVEGAFLADFVHGRGDKRAGILYRNDASGKAFHDSFKSHFESLGGQLVFTDSHNPGETDFRPFVEKVRAVPQLDVLFVASYGPEVAKYLQQAREVGVSRPVIAYTTFYSPKVLEIAGGASEGVCFSAPAFDASSDQTTAVELRNKIAARFGSRESNYYVASHYDAMMMLLQQVHAGARDGDSLRERLRSVKAYEGISGTITFNSDGGCTLPLKMYQVKGGKFVALSE